jgi:hypothetical protein
VVVVAQTLVCVWWRELQLARRLQPVPCGAANLGGGRPFQAAFANNGPIPTSISSRFLNFPLSPTPSPKTDPYNSIKKPVGLPMDAWFVTRQVLEALGGIANVDRVVPAAVQRSPPWDLIHGQGSQPGRSL